MKDTAITSLLIGCGVYAAVFLHDLIFHRLPLPGSRARSGRFTLLGALIVFCFCVFFWPIVVILLIAVIGFKVKLPGVSNPPDWL
jgi:hypothetical protein